MITIHGHPASTYTRSLRMAALEVGAAHTVEMPPFGTAQHAQLHPWRKMPALGDGDVHLFETLAGMAWLDRDAGRLIPPDPLQRALVLQWCSALVDYVYDGVVGLGHLAGEAAIPAEALDAAVSQLHTLEAAWSRWPAGELTAAHLLLFPMLEYASRVPAFAAAVADCPQVQRFQLAMRARTSAQETTP